MSIDNHLPQVLRPFNKDEAWPLKFAAWYVGKSEATLRGWAARYDIGRRIANGPWMISGAALIMLADGDFQSLRSYLAGDRTSDTFREYLHRANEARTGGTRHAA